MKFIIEYLKQYGVNPDTTATILLTLLIFIAGLFSSWMANKLKSWKEKNSYRKSLKAILLEFQKACERQSKIVNNRLDKIGLKSGNDFVISYIPIGTLEYLTNIDFNIFLQNFEPFFSKKTFPKAISKLFDLLAIIKNQNESLDKDLKWFADRFTISEKNYNDNIEELRKIVENLRIKYDGKQISVEEGGQLIADYFDIFNKWFKNGAKTNILATYNEIVIPAQELGIRHPNIPLILPISDHALQCYYAYQNIQKIDNFLIKRYQKFSFAHRRASKMLLVILRII